MNDDEQRQRNRERDDHRRAEAHQKEHQHDQDENHAAQQIVFDRARRQLHQVAAVVEGTHFDVGRQDVFVQLLRFRLDAFQHVLRLLAGEHQDHAFDGVVRLVEAEFAEARRVADRHVADILHAHRHAVLRSHDHVADVLRIAQQAQPAHVVELPALRVKPATRVRIVHRKLLDHLWNCDVVAVKPRRIEQHLILHHRAAEPRIVRHAPHLLVLRVRSPSLRRSSALAACGPGFRSRSGRQAQKGLKAAPASASLPMDSSLRSGAGKRSAERNSCRCLHQT